MKATVAQQFKRRRLRLLICSGLSKKKAGPEYTEQYDLSDSVLQVILGASSSDPHEVPCCSSKMYTLFLAIQSSSARCLDTDAVWCPPFGFYRSTASICSSFPLHLSGVSRFFIMNSSSSICTVCCEGMAAASTHRRCCSAHLKAFPFSPPRLPEKVCHFPMTSFLPFSIFSALSLESSSFSLGTGRALVA